MSTQPAAVGGWIFAEELPDNNYVAGEPLVGGIVKVFLAGGPLNVGDHVYFSGLNQVNKSAVAADYVKRSGIVVGGDLTGMECQSEAVAVGRPAASNVAVGGSVPSRVIVCIQGVAWVIADAVIAVGAPISGSILVAGRVRTAVLPVAAADSRVVGQILKAAGAAADVRQALISVAG